MDLSRTPRESSEDLQERRTRGHTVSGHAAHSDLSSPCSPRLRGESSSVASAAGRTSGILRTKSLLRVLASRSAQDCFTTSRWVGVGRAVSVRIHAAGVNAA